MINCIYKQEYSYLIDFRQQIIKMRNRTMTSIDAYQHANSARYVPILQSKQIGIISKIVLPLVNEYMSLNHQIKWYRCYGTRTQYLPYLDNSKTYECSPLDFNCKIQAIVEYPIGFKCSKSSLPYEIRIVKPQRSSVKEKYQYQVTLQNQNFIIKPQLYQGARVPIKIVFDLLYQTTKQASWYIQDKIIIKGRFNYELSFQEIHSIYASDISSLQITIPLLTQDKFHKKIFAQKQPHKFRSIPVKILFCNYQAFSSVLMLINKLKAASSFLKDKIEPFRFQKPEVYLSFLGDKAPNQGYKTYITRLLSKPSNISTDILNITSPSHSQNPEIMSVRISPNQSNKTANNFNGFNLKGSQLLQRNVYKNSNIVSSQNNFEKDIGTQQNSFNFMEDFDELFQDEKEERQLCLNSSFDELQKNNQPFQDMKIITQIQNRKKQQNNKQAQTKKIIEKMIEAKQEISKLQQCNKKLKNQIQIIKQLSEEPCVSVNQLQATINSMKKYELKIRKQIALGKELNQPRKSINPFDIDNFQLQIGAKQ